MCVSCTRPHPPLSYKSRLHSSLDRDTTTECATTAIVHDIPPSDTAQTKDRPLDPSIINLTRRTEEYGSHHLLNAIVCGHRAIASRPSEMWGYGRSTMGQTPYRKRAFLRGRRILHSPSNMVLATILGTVPAHL